MEKYNVLVVDDQNMSRKLFELTVESDERYHVLYSLTSAKTAHIYCARYPIDLVLMDVVMNDGSNGIEAAKRIKEANPDIKVIIVTSMPEVSYLKRAREAGADSFWYKEADEAPLLQVMDRTMAGESVYPDHSPEVTMGFGKSSEFTNRELDVLREMTTGATNQEIADRLCISVGTVRTHIQHMVDATGLSRTQLAIRASASGLIVTDGTQGG